MPSTRTKAQELRRQMNSLTLEELWPFRKTQVYEQVVSKKVKVVTLCNISSNWHPLNRAEIKYIENAASRFFSKHKNKSYTSFLKVFDSLLNQILNHLRRHI